MEYLQESSGSHTCFLHFLEMCNDKTYNVTVRFMWFCITAIATVSAMVIIMSLWEKFQKDPTITATEAIDESEEIIFPVIIICPKLRYDPKKVQKLSLTLGGTNKTRTALIEEFLKSIVTMSFGTKMEQASNISSLISAEWFGNRNLRQLAFEVRPDCGDLMVDCRYENIDINCCEEFRLIYSEHGFCYGLNNNFESIENETIAVPKVWYTQRSSTYRGMSVLPLIDHNLYVISPDENYMPGFHEDYPLIENASLALSMRSSLIYVTDEIRDLTILQRKCIFRNELKLTYYSGNYSLTNCFKECVLKRAFEICKCRPPFSIPVETFRMCGIEDLACLAENSYEIRNLQKCPHCHPTCHRNDIMVVKLTQTVGRKGLFIFWVSWPNMRYKTEIVFGWIDLLVAFGGIASLFIGFSLLSGIEIVYYFTLRTCCMIYKNKDTLIEMQERTEPPPRINLHFKREDGQKVSTDANVLTKLPRQRQQYRFHRSYQVAPNPPYRNPFESVQPSTVSNSWMSKEYVP